MNAAYIENFKQRIQSYNLINQDNLLMYASKYYVREIAEWYCQLEFQLCL